MTKLPANAPYVSAVSEFAKFAVVPLMAQPDLSTAEGEMQCADPRFGDADEAHMDKLNSDPLDAVERCVAAAMKGFVIGAGLKGGLALFGILGRLRRRASGRGAARELSPAFRTVWKETGAYGLFLGTFAGGYCIVDEAISAIGGLKRTSRWRPLLCGAAAGPALLLTGGEVGHTSMALYILLRAAVLGARCGIKSRRWGWLFRPLSWQHGDVLLMCLSSSQILYAWILEPHSLPSSYISFLNKHGGKDGRIIQAVKEVASLHRPLPGAALIKSTYAEKGVSMAVDSDITIPCQILHPHQLCSSHVLSFLGMAYWRAIPVYLPVYVVPALLVHRTAILHRPLPILKKTLLGAARSSLFLATYCSSAWLWTCCLHQLAGVCKEWTLALGTFPAGLSVLIEKKSRRMELALYCLSRAIESFGLCIHKWGWLGGMRGIPKRLDVVLFSLATAGIMHCYNNERDVFRSKYLNVLDWVFGVPPFLKLTEEQKQSLVEKSRPMVVTGRRKKVASVQSLQEKGTEVDLPEPVGSSADIKNSEISEEEKRE